jgi:hypothetical protein
VWVYGYLTISSDSPREQVFIAWGPCKDSKQRTSEQVYSAVRYGASYQLKPSFVSRFTVRCDVQTVSNGSHCSWTGLQCVWCEVRKQQKPLFLSRFTVRCDAKTVRNRSHHSWTGLQCVWCEARKQQKPLFLSRFTVRCDAKTVSNRSYCS